MGVTTEDEIRQRLQAVDSAALSDALDALDLPNGVMAGLSLVSGLSGFVGRAVTVRLEVSDGTPAARHLAADAVDHAQPGDVIVVANDGRCDTACWGGNLAQACVLRGIAGVVLDGCTRDIQEVRDLDLPIAARGIMIRAARGRIREADWGQTVSVAGTTVNPRDWIVADASGIVTLPHRSISEILDRAERIVAKERAMAADLQNGRPLREVMGASYEHALQRGLR